MVLEKIFKDFIIYLYIKTDMSPGGPNLTLEIMIWANLVEIH